MSPLVIALIAAGIGAVASVGIAPFVNARLQRRNARRAAHEPAVAAARVIQRELETIYAAAEDATSQGIDAIELPTAAWDANHVAVAARLDPKEFMVVERYYAWVRHGAVPALVALYPLARDAIGWLAAGEANQVKPRRIETALAPANMDLACRCGHAFGAHGWRAERRRIRITRRDAKFKDIGYECKRCDCERFKARAGRLHYI